MFFRSSGSGCQPLPDMKSISLLVRLKTALDASFTGAGVGTLDKPEGPATALLVRSKLAGLSGEFTDGPGFLKGEENLFLAPSLLDVGVLPKPTRRCGAGVLISIGCSLFGVVIGSLGVDVAATMLVAVRSGVLKSDNGSITGAIRCGVEFDCISARKGVLAGGGIEDVGRLGDSTLSSPNIANACRRAA